MCFMFRTWLLAASHLSVEEGWCAAMSPCSLSLSCSQRARQSTNVVTMNSQNYPQSHVDNPHVLQRECCTCGTSQCGSWVCVCYLLHLCMSADDHLTKWQSTFLCKSVFESHADSTSECFPAPQGDVKWKVYLGNVSSGKSPYHLMAPSLKQTAVSPPLASRHPMSSFSFPPM